MSMSLTPYLAFNGNARQAMDFYQSVFGGELTVSTFGDFKEMREVVADPDQVMHAMLTTVFGLTLMASDGMDEQPRSGNVSLALSGDDEAELRSYWSKLVVDGQIIQPLETAVWGDTFGMCTDRFGVRWMLSIAGRPPQ